MHGNTVIVDALQLFYSCNIFMHYNDKVLCLMGVLNDYDLSSLANAQSPQGNERTGTIPFMALDLLTEKGQRGEVQHLYRHDLESFMWVLVWVAWRYKDGQLLPRKIRPLDKWATVDAEQCDQEKKTFLDDFLEYELPDIEMPIADLLLDCFEAFNKDHDRRRELMFKQWRPQTGASGHIMVEKLELDDWEFLNLFTTTVAWV